MKHEKQQSVLFTAELQHSEETFYRLARVQAQLYGALGKVFVIFCGFALIAAALFALQESTGRLVLLFFGCWTISCSALPARRTAERLVRAANGNFPLLRCGPCGAVQGCFFIRGKQGSGPKSAKI